MRKNEKRKGEDLTGGRKQEEEEEEERGENRDEVKELAEREANRTNCECECECDGLKKWADREETNEGVEQKEERNELNTRRRVMK